MNNRRKPRSSRRWLLLVGVLALVGVLPACEAVTFVCDVNWIGTDNGNWSQASNWDTGAVPGATQNACIPAPNTVNVIDAVEVGSVAAMGNHQHLDRSHAPG